MTPKFFANVALLTNFPNRGLFYRFEGFLKKARASIPDYL